MAIPTRLALQAKTVHIKVHPITRTFAERTEVLRVLERFGQVDYFRSLKSDAAPNTFISIFNQAEAAEKVINSSPIRYRLMVEPAPDTSAINPHRSPEIKALEAAEEADDAANKSTQNEPQERIFELRLSPSSYPHQQTIEKSPLYGSWKPISTRRSAIAADLYGRLPREKLLSGLRDWETGALGTGYNPDSGSDSWFEGGDEVVYTVQPSQPWRMRRQPNKPKAGVIRGLRQMYEESQRSGTET